MRHIRHVKESRVCLAQGADAMSARHNRLHQHQATRLTSHALSIRDFDTFHPII